jgi:SAM-dependent methyltransferase
MTPAMAAKVASRLCGIVDIVGVLEAWEPSKGKITSRMDVWLLIRWNRIKARLATPFLRRLLRRPSHLALREELARQYIRGDGIEVGALNAPLRLPDYAKVRYVDYQAGNVLQAAYSYLGEVQQPEIISDMESLLGLDDASLDFLIANHVLEHVENPLRALNAVSRVLRRGGIAFITLPDKRFTFDKRRAITPLGHIVKDFNDGPSGSRREHYRDWAANVEQLAAKEVEGRATVLEGEVSNIHFHVWDFPAMREMFDYAAPLMQLTVEEARENRGEAIWVLRKL